MSSLWRSDRLVYRMIEEDDIDFLETLLTPDDFSHVDVEYPKPRWLGRKIFDDITQEHALVAMICLPDSTVDNEEHLAPIGVINLSASPADMQQHRAIGIGLAIGSRFQRRGYGTEAVYWAVDWGFKRMNLHRVWLSVLGYNPDALRLYKRMGFVEETHERKAVWRGGRYYDDITLSILENEWRARRAVPSR
ncbi:hypothetical protein ANO11243_016830 [Dothideomycetidae sp. 11243]|nr:hypothetical protein ANO11243_016830 [fungal sp. No.11243]